MELFSDASSILAISTIDYREHLLVLPIIIYTSKVEMVGIEGDCAEVQATHCRMNKEHIIIDFSFIYGYNDSIRGADSMNDSPDLVIVAGDGVSEEAALALSKRVGAPLSDTMGEGLTLAYDKSGLSLVGYGMRFQGDYEALLRRISGGRLSHEMLVKIAKTKTEHPVAIDAAAGMGEDALLLAAAGYTVYLFEQDAVIAALLSDTIERAKRTPALKEVVDRMILTEGNSIELMSSIPEKPDLIYLDPMFPARSKSGLVNKKLQLIQKLEQPCAQERELLEAALSLRPNKIVVKRPLNGETLAGRKPSYTIKGKAIRYDVIVPSSTR